MALRSSVAALIGKISRLSVNQAGITVRLQPCGRCIHTQRTPLLFHATDQLWGAPLKKKKKMDPALLLAKENKRKKKMEKQMKRLERFGRRLKPIEEIEGDLKIRRELQMRRRPPVEHTTEEKEIQALLHKQWSRAKIQQHCRESLAWATVANAQQRALDELRFESEELYQMAIQLDDTLVPLEFKGPTFTPPITDYQSPDGEYIDVTKTYE